jgi:hypothetical protein
MTFVGRSPPAPAFDTLLTFSASSFPKLAKLPPLKLFRPPIARALTFSAFESESKNLFGALKIGGEDEESSEK